LIIKLGEREIDVQLKRSARARWARLEVHLRRGVRVILPASAPESDAVRFIHTKAEWLTRAIARIDRLRRRVPDRRLVTGERLPYLDETLTLEVSNGPLRVERRGSILAVSVPRRVESRVRAAIEEWVAAQAEAELGRRVRETAARFGIAIRGIRISSARSRWGSCSSTGIISLSWRLMLAPSRIADYLVAHELAHVAHRNHSAGFWSRVAALCPAYRDAERWLRKHGVGAVI
jgi:predicted metal-dependent hydrolase